MPKRKSSNARATTREVTDRGKNGQKPVRPKTQQDTSVKACSDLGEKSAQPGIHVEIKEKDTTKFQQRKYKSRTIEDNWARYDEDNADTPDAKFANAGADFEDLVSQSGTQTSSFAFQDELDWNLSMVEETPVKTLSKNQTLLNIDLQRIAKSLDQINSSEKLALSPTLEIISKVGFSWHGEYLEKMKNETPTSKDFCETQSSGSASPIEWCYDDGDDIFNCKGVVTNCLEKISQKHGNLIEHHAHTGGTLKGSELSTKETSVSCGKKTKDSMKLEELKLEICEIEHADSKKAEETKDDELDFLLSISMPQKG
eukprot:gene20421-22434_t